MAEFEQVTEEIKSSKALIQNLSFCVLDLETTGGNHQLDKIIEIGLVKIINLEITETLTFLIDPQIPIPDFVQKLTSIKQADLLNRPTLIDVIDEVVSFIGDSILVAHNSSFDIPFLNSELDRLGKPLLKNKTLCTNLMSKYLIPNIMNSNLSYMSKIFNIGHGRAHRALDDAFATAQLLLKFLNFFIEKGIKKINHLYYPRKKFELDIAHLKNDISHSKILSKISNIKSPLVITLKDEKGIILSCLPLENPPEELKIVDKLLNELPWRTITLKMVGSIVEAFFLFHHHFYQLKKDMQAEIIQYLCVFHLGKDQVNGDSPPFKGDFLITKHLIPGQFIIYPLTHYRHKNELVFRYQGQEKKFDHFIKNHLKILKKTENIKTMIFPPLLNFFAELLEKLFTNSINQQFFIFSKEQYLRNSKETQISLRQFLQNELNIFNYPNEHL